MLLFLSYADEDKDLAQEVAWRLKRQHVKIYPPQNGHIDDDSAIGGPEDVIGQADAFLALLSPNFLASSSCRRERELALHREQRGWTDGNKSDFVQVLHVRETPYHEAGLLRGRPWFDLTTQTSKENALNDLASKFEPAGNAAASDPAESTHHELPGFRNRNQELDQVVDGLTKEDGQHFWFVIAPPKLGKSWFLHRIRRDILAREPGRWMIRLVDVRDHPVEVRSNAEELLNIMFGTTHRPATEPTNLRKQAIDIIKANRFQLFMLDSAELLDDNTARTVRSYISEITRYVDEARKKNVRLALMVASRRDQVWLGVTPRPRLQLLPLTEFKVDIVYEALQELSEHMERDPSPAELQEHADLVYHLSEGLPALLYRYLNWIYEEQWTGLPRLREKEQFDKLTKPYIEQELVSASSLFGLDAVSSGEQLLGLKRALEVLVPYRLFTQSHLRHHAQPDSALQSALQALGWSVEELWQAVSSTDLLSRPLREPWQEIYAPIRRLLCRHWYSLDASLVQAHRKARQFVRSWADGQMGSDQSVVLVECLWHEVQVLSLSRSAEPDEKMIGLASELSRGLVSSTAYTQNDLRQYAIARITNDDELVEAVEDIGVSIDRLVDAIQSPDVGASP